MELVFLDTETTGNDVEKDYLCQVCYRAGGTTYVGYFKPPVPVSVKAMSITHITNHMLEGKETFAESQMKKDLQALLADGVMVAHNAKFDRAILQKEGVEIPRFICTLRVARYLDQKNLIPEYNLQFLRYFLDLKVDGHAHDAEGDVNVLCAVFERLLSKMIESCGDRETAIQKMIEVSAQPTIFTVFNFGKHKDKRVEEVAKSDKNYLEWLLATKTKDGEQDEDWIHTLRHFLGITV
ncbi:MAG: Exonuclease RNase and polymerase [Parcubacteria group bacterium]|nr:Exonuclease RNase and polymerase [Parcubacteria group bacterium]